LTEQEANNIANDSRVQSVTRPYYHQGYKVGSMTSQTSNYFDKSSTNDSNHINWGLLRGFERQQRTNWGSDQTSQQSGTITLTGIGRNVDVLIMDGHLVPQHPEWAVNSDGTGGSRLNQFNWFSYNSQVRGISAGTYVYDFGTATTAISDNNHGNIVGAIAAGNTCGWARGSNIYNMSPYSTSANASGYANYLYDMFNYVKLWHLNKSTNSNTGLRNPTVCNMSFGLWSSTPIANVTNIHYRGQNFPVAAGTLSATYRIYAGLVTSEGVNLVVNTRDASLDADITDCIAAGIIFVGAAGNFLMYNDNETGANYNNSITNTANQIIFYHRGPSPGCAPGVINVSAVDSTALERKADYSNAGPRTDIFAPGTNIMGANFTNVVADPRNASFYKAKGTGTSMASPQVCGVLGCLLETYPRLSASQAKSLLRSIANQGVLSGDVAYDYTWGNTGYPYLQYNSLFTAENFYFTYKSQRNINNQVYPSLTFGQRGSYGRTYPRVKIRGF
jgi:hypothetical protein